MTVAPTGSRPISTAAACDAGLACGEDDDCNGPCLSGVCSDGIAVLGLGQHTSDSVTMTEVVSNLRVPMDLAFHPDRPDELWITNQDGNTMWIGPSVAAGNVSRRPTPC